MLGMKVMTTSLSQRWIVGRIVILAGLLVMVPGITRAQVKGTITITHGDAGGNGAAYGLTFLNGPANRTQIFACPRSSSGLQPTGRIECSTTYGSSSAAEWQPGDTLTASAAPETSAEVPFELRTGGVFLCAVRFAGWGGPCTGLGILNTTRNLYECSFPLPMSGPVHIVANYAGNSDGDPCIPIANPVATSTPRPGPTVAPSPTDEVGNLVLSVLTTAADQFADNLKLRQIIRRTAKFIIPKTPAFSYDVGVTVNAVSEGRNQANFLNASAATRQPKLESIKSKPIIASGRGKSLTTRSRTIKLASTAKGVRVAKGRKKLGVRVTVTGRRVGETIPRIITSRIIFQ